MFGPYEAVEKENTCLRKENRLLREKRNIKTLPSFFQAKIDEICIQ